MVKSIYSEAEFQAEIQAPGKLVVVDFFATWCGPCKMIAPFIEQLSGQYNDVSFLKVNEADCRELIVGLGVSAFPTFYFYLGGNKVDELKGADPRQLQSKIDYYRTQIPSPYAGTAMQLGSSSGLDPREARLKRLGQKPVSEAEAQRMMTEALAKAAAAPATSSEDAKASVDDAEAQEPMDIVGSNASEDLVNQLIEMGFAEVRARKATKFGQTLDEAINWLTEHQDDPDIDDPIPTQEELDHQNALELLEAESAQREVPLSEEERAQRLEELKNNLAQRRAEAAQESAPLTEEEKAQKLAELKEKMARRRAEREAAERAAELDREKDRREMGKKIGQTSQELEALQRKRDAEKAKREKEEAKRERDRLRAEIARDKAERKAHGGKLASKLGVEGYNPSAVQYDAGTDGTGAEAQQEEQKQPTIDDKPADEQVNWSIERMARYRVAGDGGVALRTVRKLVDNLVTNPSEEKFRSINMENKALKQRVFALVGGLQILKAVGFRPSEEDNTKLALSDTNMDLALLTQTRAKLDAAIEVYSRVNPGY